MYSQLVAALDALLYKGFQTKDVFDALCPNRQSTTPQLIHFVNSLPLIEAVQRGHVPRGSRYEINCNIQALRLQQCFANPRIAMWYISENHLAATMYVVHAVDVHLLRNKRYYDICQQVGVYTTAAIQSGNFFSICLSQSTTCPAKRGDAVECDHTTVTASTDYKNILSRPD